MSTLTGNKISITYKSLIKVSDNDILTATLQQLSDGLGNNSGVYLNTGGDLKSTGTLEFANFKATAHSVTINKLVNEADGISNNDNDTSLPTSAAVKDYVDTHVTSQDLDFSDGTNQSAVDLDSQVLAIVGTSNEIETTASGQQLQIGLPNSVTISGTYTGATFSGDLHGTINTATTAVTQSAGDNSTKVATTAYVDTLDAASDLDFSGDSGTGAVNLNTQVFAITGTSNQIESTASGQGLSLNFPSSGVVLPNGSTATTQSSSDDSTKVATTAYVKSLNNASDLDFTTDSGSGAVVLNSQTLSVDGTTNQINTAGSGQAITLSLAPTIHRNLQGNVTGNLTGNADTATKWATARDLSLTSEATATLSNVDGTGNVSGAVTLLNSAVTGKVLTGLPTPAAGNIVASDSILEAFGKLQSQVSSISNGLIFKGSWDANTNTPTLTSGGGEVDSGTTTGQATNKLIQSGQNFNTTVSIGDKVINQVDGTTALVTNIDSNTQLTLDADIMLSGEAYTIDASPFIQQGNYYVVNYAGTTNLNGIANWSVGDWVIADADNRWSKLDHSQVDGQGTIGNLAKFTASNVIGDSIVSESGTALTVTGSLTTTGDVTIPDYIYHSGDSNTSMGFPTNDEWKVTVGGSTKLFADANASYLYYQGNLKLSTTSAGATVTGGLHSNYVKIEGSADSQLYLQSSTSGTPLWTINARNDSYLLIGRVGVRNDLYFDGSGNATFAGITTGIGTYTAGNSVKIFEAQRSGGAVKSDWSYHDANTTMSFGTSTSHPLSIKTADTERIRVQNNGNIGINNNNPTEILDISDDDGDTNIRVSDSSANSEVGLKLKNDAKTWTLQNWGSGGDNLRILNNSGAIVQLWDDNGNVMIGNANDPVVPLHVVGTAVNNPSNGSGGYEVMQIFDDTSYATGVGGGIGLGGNFTSSNSTIFSEIRGIKENSTDNNYAGALTFSTRANGANITERMRIESDGTSILRGLVKINTGAESSNPRLYFQHDTLNVNNFIEVDRGTGAMEFYNNGSERMRIDSSGTIISSKDGAGLQTNLLLSNLNDTNGDATGIGFSMLNNNTYVKAGIFFERTTTQGRGSLIFATNNEVNGNNVTLSDERMRIDNSGNLQVGDGTISAAGMIHAYKSSALADLVLQSAGGSGRAWRFVSDTDGKFYIRDNNAASNRLYIDTSGNVGIGTTSPNLSSSGTALTVNSSSGANAAVEISDGGTLAGLLWGRSGTGVNVWSIPSIPLIFGTANTERMRIDSSGNVGINYTTPFNQISGANETTLAISNSNVASLYLNNTATNGHNHILFSGTGGALSFYDKNRGDYNMVIDSSGNVAINYNNSNIYTYGGGAYSGKLIVSLYKQKYKWKYRWKRSSFNSFCK